MTPKEKAEELVEKFEFSFAGMISNEEDWESLAKQCALIAVDELINTEYQTVSKLLEVIQKNKIRLVISLNKDYWQEVKQEIEKL
jgi:hypothetical protein